MASILRHQTSSVKGMEEISRPNGEGRMGSLRVPGAPKPEKAAAFVLFVAAPHARVPGWSRMRSGDSHAAPGKTGAPCSA